MNGAPGTRTPGRSGEVAEPPSICHRTRCGSVKTSARNPKPGIWQVKPNGSGATPRVPTSRQVPRLGPGHAGRPGQRVDDTEVYLPHLRHGRFRGQLPVQRVAGLQNHLVARVALEDGRDVGMPAVVPRLGLDGQGAAPVDPDL